MYGRLRQVVLYGPNLVLHLVLKVLEVVNLLNEADPMVRVVYAVI